MNSERDASLVGIQLWHCAPADATAVFAVLRSAYPHSPELGGNGEEDTGNGRRVWLGTIDVRGHGEVERAATLSRPTEIDLSGTPDAVHHVRDVLADFFEVVEQPRISGDQEVEVRLRLAPR